MNIEKQLEKLAATARSEKFPMVDVARAVMGKISHQTAYETASERQFVWFAVISSAAAAIVVAAAAYYINCYDPITEISQTIFWVIQ